MALQLLNFYPLATGAEYFSVWQFYIIKISSPSEILVTLTSCVETTNVDVDSDAAKVKSDNSDVSHELVAASNVCIVTERANKVRHSQLFRGQG